jgi:hypothetical protein
MITAACHWSQERVHHEGTKNTKATTICAQQAHSFPPRRAKEKNFTTKGTKNTKFDNHDEHRPTYWTTHTPRRHMRLRVLRVLCGSSFFDAPVHVTSHDGYAVFSFSSWSSCLRGEFLS